MPYAPQHKKESRLRILQSAAQCFLHQGYERTNIDEIMQQAGLTRGAFYAHFSSKSDLYAKAMLHAARHGRLVTHHQNVVSEDEWLDDLLEGYLSVDHLDGEELPCPMAFLVTDIANREPQVRHAYTQIYKQMNRLIGRHLDRPSEAWSDKTYALTAMMIGGVALARVVDDPGVQEKLLQSCKQAAHRLMSL